MKKFIFIILFVYFMSNIVTVYAEPKIIYWSMDENIVIDDNNIMYKTGSERYKGFEKAAEKIKNIYPGQSDQPYYIISDEDVLYEVTDKNKTEIDTAVKDVVETRGSAAEGIWYIKNDNSLWGMGENKYGQLGDGSFDSKTRPIKIMDNIIKADSLDNMFFALTKDNELFIWGECSRLLNSQTRKIIAKPVKVLDNVADYAFKLSYGLNVFGLYIDTYGKLYAWEINDGIFGNREKTMSFEEKPSIIMNDVSSFKVYASYALIEKNDHTLWFWGKNYCNLAGDENISIVAEPKEIEQQVKDYSFFANFVLILKENGDLIRYTDLNNSRVMSSDCENILYKDVPLNGIKRILKENDSFKRTFNSTAYVLDNNNYVYGMGDNFYNNLGIETEFEKSFFYEPVKIEFLTNLYAKDNLPQSTSHNLPQQSNNHIIYFMLITVFFAVIAIAVRKI